MLTVHPQYITNAKGEKLSVVLSIQEYNSILEELEELEDNQLYVTSINDNEVAIPIDKAFDIIEHDRLNRK